MIRRISAVLVSLVLATLASPARARSTWYVDVNATAPGSGTLTAPYTTIQYAIEQPSTLNGDTLLVAAGHYVENLVISKELNIRGVQGPLATVIDGNSAGSVISYAGVGGPNQVLQGFTITNGMALRGGGLSSVSVSPRILDCIIVDNHATIQGGGLDIQVDPGGTTVLSRCVVSQNSAPIGGACYMFYAFDVLIENCTIADNTASLASALYIGAFSSPVVSNTIVWGHGPGAILLDFAANPQFSYSNVEGGWPGVAVLASDPLFWGAPGNYYLMGGSPCIDSGDPNSPPDPDGSRADMGVYPFDPEHCGPNGIYCVAKVNSVGCVPSISISGKPSLTDPGPFLVEATQVVNNKAGILIYGFDWLTLPFQGGLLCISPPIRRTPVQYSGGNPPPNDCSGSYSFDFNAFAQSGGEPTLTTGTTVYSQYWSRDKNAANGTGLTDAARFTLCP